MSTNTNETEAQVRIRIRSRELKKRGRGMFNGRGGVMSPEENAEVEASVESAIARALQRQAREATGVPPRKKATPEVKVENALYMARAGNRLVIEYGHRKEGPRVYVTQAGVVYGVHRITTGLSVAMQDVNTRLMRAPLAPGEAYMVHCGWVRLRADRDRYVGVGLDGAVTVLAGREAAVAWGALPVQSAPEEPDVPATPALETPTPTPETPTPTKRQARLEARQAESRAEWDVFMGDVHEVLGVTG